VDTIRCDNAPENKQLEAMIKREKLGIRFEYTAPATPQQNGVVERRFATLFGRVRTMNTAAGLYAEFDDNYEQRQLIVRQT
jgi:transposase InsO family protein